MRTTGHGLCLRVYVHEWVRHGGRPLYVALVELAQREGLAGATVFRGMEGFGQHRHLHTSRLLDVSDDLPMIVEFVDAEATIRRFAGLLEAYVPHGAAVMASVATVTYGPERRT